MVLLPTPTAHYRLAGDTVESLGGTAGVWTGTPAYSPMANGGYGATFNGAKKVTIATAPTDTIGYYADGQTYIKSGSDYYVGGVVSGAFTPIATATTIGDAWTGTVRECYFYASAFSAAQAAELHKRLKRRVSNNIINVAAGATPPGDRANEVFATRNGALDLSKYKRSLTNDCAVIGNEWMSFDGGTCKIKIDPAPALTGICTVYATLNRTSAGGGNLGRILSNNRFILYGTSSSIAFTSNNATVATSGAGTFSNGIPTRIAIRRYQSGSTWVVDFWINGVAVASGVACGTPLAGSEDLYIGNYAAANRGFDGLIKDLVVREEYDSDDRIIMDWQRNRRTW